MAAVNKNTLVIENLDGEVIHIVKGRKSLCGANLSGVNLRYADLKSHELSKVNFSGADLYGADLSGTDLFKTNFYNANLYGANLLGAKFSSSTILKGANLHHAIIFENYRLVEDNSI